jgi:hypothetical protein
MTDQRLATITPDEVEAIIRLAEYHRKAQRRARWTRRAKKAGLVAIVPITGPLAGSIWAEQEAKGWR